MADGGGNLLKSRHLVWVNLQWGGAGKASFNATPLQYFWLPECWHCKGRCNTFCNANAKYFASCRHVICNMLNWASYSSYKSKSPRNKMQIWNVSLSCCVVVFFTNDQTFKPAVCLGHLSPRANSWVFLNWELKIADIQNISFKLVLSQTIQAVLVCFSQCGWAVTMNTPAACFRKVEGCKQLVYKHQLGRKIITNRCGWEIHIFLNQGYSVITSYCV